jgi:hypothetical protein
MGTTGVFIVMITGMGLSSLLVGCEGKTTTWPSSQTAGESQDSKPHGRPVIRTAKILPTPATRNVLLEILVEADGPNTAPVTFRYQWIVNGAPAGGETARTFDPGKLALGDRISVELIPSSAGGEGTPFRVQEVVIANSPPVIRTLAIGPNDARADTPLQAYAEAYDVDYDQVHVTYQWFRNDRLAKEGDEPFLNAGEYRAEDVITVKGTPADSHGVGQPVRSGPVTIQNAAPNVTSLPPDPNNLEHYEYSVRAVDPDGDRMKFSLPVALPGMTIAEDSGSIVWRIPSGTQGTHKAQIRVEDGRGGSVTQDIQLTLPAPVGS